MPTLLMTLEIRASGQDDVTNPDPLIYLPVTVYLIAAFQRCLKPLARVPPSGANTLCPDTFPANVHLVRGPAYA